MRSAVYEDSLNHAGGCAPIPSARRCVNLRFDRTGKDQGAVFFRTSSATISIIAWFAIFVDRLMDGNPTSTRAAVA